MKTDGTVIDDGVTDSLDTNGIDDSGDVAADDVVSEEGVVQTVIEKLSEIAGPKANALWAWFEANKKELASQSGLPPESTQLFAWTMWEMIKKGIDAFPGCLLYTSPSPRDS